SLTGEMRLENGSPLGRIFWCFCTALVGAAMCSASHDDFTRMTSNPYLGFEPTLEMTLAKFENAPYKTVRPKLNVSQYKRLILSPSSLPPPPPNPPTFSLKTIA